jgi:hypothetical protein
MARAFVGSLLLLLLTLLSVSSVRPEQVESLPARSSDFLKLAPVPSVRPDQSHLFPAFLGEPHAWVNRLARRALLVGALIFAVQHPRLFLHPGGHRRAIPANDSRDRQARAP